MLEWNGMEWGSHVIFQCNTVECNQPTACYMVLNVLANYFFHCKQKTPIVLDMHAFESARKLNQWLPTKCNIYILLYNAHMATSVRVHATHQWWW